MYSYYGVLLNWINSRFHFLKLMNFIPSFSQVISYYFELLFLSAHLKKVAFSIFPIYLNWFEFKLAFAAAFSDLQKNYKLEGKKESLFLWIACELLGLKWFQNSHYYFFYPSRTNNISFYYRRWWVVIDDRQKSQFCFLHLCCICCINTL